MEFRPMSPQEIERTMQFIVHKSEQIAATLGRLSANVDRMTDGIARLKSRIDREPGDHTEGPS